MLSIIAGIHSQELIRPTIYFLRSFGDFVIAIAVLRRSPVTFSYRLLASVHLEPLYLALQEVIPDLDLQISFIDLGIRNKILGFFTNKHFFNPHSIHEFFQLRVLMKEQDGNQANFFEQQKRLWLINLFSGKKSYPVHTAGNVYDSYCDRFQVDPKEMLYNMDEKSQCKVLILPESRMVRKELPQKAVVDLIHSLIEKSHDVTTAFFREQPYPVPGSAKVHLYFGELISLISDADYIITADSLPAHLAQLLSKPHHIHYRKSPSHSWMTPFARKYHQYSTFK